MNICKKGKYVNSIADRYDIFTAPVPNFNLEGSSKTGSFIGLIFTLFLYMIMSVYCWINFWKIKADPAISKLFVEESLPGDYLFNL